MPIAKMKSHELIEKLQGFNEVDPLELKEGDHIRYTKKGFQTKQRKCVYAVIKTINGSALFVQSYKGEYEWTVDFNNKKQELRFYKKPA